MCVITQQQPPNLKSEAKEEVPFTCTLFNGQQGAKRKKKFDNFPYFSFDLFPQ